MGKSNILNFFSRTSCGFALLEVAVGLSILSLGVGLIGTSVFQVLSIQRYWQDDRVATKDLRHTGSWFAGDALNAETVVFGGTLKEPTVTLTWVEIVNDNPLTLYTHQQKYSLDGDRLVRTYEGVDTTVAKDVDSAEFSLMGNMLKLEMKNQLRKRQHYANDSKNLFEGFATMTSLLKGQQGVAMIMVIAFMSLSIPMITGALSLSSTLSRDSTVKTEILKRQYSALGGDQFGGYCIQNGCPLGDNPIELNDDPISVVIGNPPSELYPPPPADDSRRLSSSITVTPDWKSPGAFSVGDPPVPNPQPFLFTVTVTNRDNDPEGLTKIHAMLPPGFDYVDGSTGGVTFKDPAVQGQKLTWNLAPQKIVLQPALPGVPAEYEQVSFMAEAILTEGNYCTEAWADPGQIKTGTGLDALIQVGSPGDNLCSGYAVSLNKTADVAGGTVMGMNPITVDYSITFENQGTLPLSLTQVRDLLPPGFVYTPGSTVGITTNDPASSAFQGRQRLDWIFDPPLTIPSGSMDNEVTFRVQGPFLGGHWNDAWLTFSEFSNTQYTWPSAGITAIKTYESDTDPESGVTVCSVMFEIGPDSYVLWQWEISTSDPC